jgi:hypothetical protein
MVALVHGERLAGGDRGADAAGAGVVLAPVAAEIEAGAAQRGVELQVADEIDRHAACIGQQHAVAHAGHLLVERLQAVACDVQELLEPLAVLAHQRRGQDHRLLHARRVQAVLVHAARPALADQEVGQLGRVEGRRLVAGQAHHRVDVLALLQFHRCLLRSADHSTPHA